MRAETFQTDAGGGAMCNLHRTPHPTGTLPVEGVTCGLVIGTPSLI